MYNLSNNPSKEASNWLSLGGIKQYLFNTDLSHDEAYLSLSSLITEQLNAVKSVHAEKDSEPQQVKDLSQLRRVINYTYLQDSGHLKKAGLAEMVESNKGQFEIPLDILKHGSVCKNIQSICQPKTSLNSLNKLIISYHQPLDETNRCTLIKQQIDAGILKICPLALDLGSKSEFWNKAEQVLSLIYNKMTSPALPVENHVLQKIYGQLLFQLSMPFYGKLQFTEAEKESCIQTLLEAVEMVKDERAKINEAKPALLKISISRSIAQQFSDYLGCLLSVRSELAGLLVLLGSKVTLD